MSFRWVEKNGKRVLQKKVGRCPVLHVAKWEDVMKDKYEEVLKHSPTWLASIEAMKVTSGVDSALVGNVDEA